MKIIFLDIDGVMNNSQHLIYSEVHEDLEFSPEAVDTLHEIIKETSAKIVISSTWRIGRTDDELRHIFAHYDVLIANAIIGQTPILPRSMSIGGRCDEITAYISMMIAGLDYKIDSFVIIDDDDFDMHFLSHLLVKCDREVGLVKDQKQQIINSLLTS